MVSRAGQAAAEQIPFLLVNLYIHGDVLKIGHDALHQGRGVHKSHDPRAQDQRPDQVVRLVNFRIYCDVADSFARQRQGFGVGIRDDAVGISRQNGRQLNAIVKNLRVCLVGKEIDGLAVFFLLFSQQPGQAGNIRFAVHPAGRIVGRVENERLGPSGDHPGNRFQIRRKIGACVRDLYHPAVVFDIKGILDEKRLEDQDFVAGIQNRLQNHIERAAGPAGHDNVIGIHFQADGPADRLGDCPPGFRVAGVGCVAVLEDDFLAGDANQLLLEFARMVHVGIAQTEIIDLVVSVPAFQKVPFFKHFADQGRLRHGGFDFLGYAHDSFSRVAPRIARRLSNVFFRYSETSRKSWNGR